MHLTFSFANNECSILILQDLLKEGFLHLALGMLMTELMKEDTH